MAGDGAAATDGKSYGGVAVTGPVRALAAAALAVVLALPAHAAEPVRRLPESQQEIRLSFAPLVREAAPAVVNIYTRRLVEEVVRSPLFDDPFFKQFFGDGFPFGPGQRRRRQQNSLGSGVIVGADGLIVTNHHVVAGADEITVALADRREFAARLVLDDESTDLAVLRIETNGEVLPHLMLGDSDAVEVGDLVLAIGNPFNVGQTVTSGIVSALARTALGIGDLQFFIQTDAAINPGNSGGALVTMDGHLVGINTAIFSRSGGSHGIGFAIPANMVRVVVESAKRGLGYVQRPWLGAATQPVTPEIATSLGLARPLGALVRALHPAGPAARVGVRVGDVVLAVDGHEVEDPQSLAFRLATRLIGGAAMLTLWRDGERLQVRLPLERAPAEPPRAQTLLSGRHPLAGATVANLSPALAEELGLETIATGVIVLKLERGSPARALRLRPGDRILRINGEEVGDVAGLQALLSQPAGDWRITLQRGDRTLNLVVRA